MILHEHNSHVLEEGWEKGVDEEGIKYLGNVHEQFHLKTREMFLTTDNMLNTSCHID